MSDIMISTASRATVAYYSFTQKLAEYAKRLEREQLGQGMVEYGGVILIIALIIATVFTSGLDTTIKTKVTDMVNHVFNHDVKAK